MMTPEGKVKAAGRQLCATYGAGWVYQLPINQGKFGRAGVPDDMLCVKGRFVCIEYKARMNWFSRSKSAYKTLPTPLQCKEMAACWVAGGIPLVIDCNSVTDLPMILQWIATADLNSLDPYIWRWDVQDYYKYLNGEGAVYWPSGTTGRGLPRYREVE